MKTAAIVVAAGSGERLGADRPKAFVVLAGRPMFEWSLDAIRAAGIDEVVMAVPAGERPSTGGLGPEDVRSVPGGATRSQSVAAALAALSPDVDAVLVHDAARPMVEAGLFVACLDALSGADAAVAAAKMTDTVKEAGDDRVVTRTHDRSRLWAIQTPQAFRRDALERALQATDDELAAATDDASLVERNGGRVVIVEAPPSNFKVTTPHDLEVAGLLLRQC